MAGDLTEYGGEERRRSGWHRLIGWFSATLGLVILAGLVTMLTLSSRQRDSALEWQRHSFEVMVAVRAIEGQMAQAEASLGRAVIASDINKARIYYDEWRRSGLMIRRLARLTRGDPFQVALVNELQDLYQLRTKELEIAALHLNYDQKVKALTVYYNAGKSENIDLIKTVFREIIDHEQRTLKARSNQAQGFMDRSNKLTTTLSLLGLFLVLGAIALGWTTLRAMSERRRARNMVEIETHRAEILEEAVAERTSELLVANERLQAEAGERAHAEAQLRQIQKMEAVGQLTGGIAHDFNNMLAVVVGGLELAKRKLNGQTQDAERHIDNAMEGANRAAALTRRLLAFARAEPLLPQAICPEELVRGMNDLMDRTLGERIYTQIYAEPDPWKIWVDRHQLENAILNLAVNARDAMEHGGTLTIRTSNTLIGEGGLGEAPPGEYIRIDVGDTGIGMSKQILERVFEPFFTTKPVGKGTGLGLSQIFGFVRQSGGDIAIASTEGAGTIVSIYLPRYISVAGRKSARKSAKKLKTTPQPPSANYVALIVEDDPRVLTATMGALEELGYQVIPATCAEDAMVILESGRHIDIIVSDVVMPGMTGPELIQKIAPQHPDLAILFVTGYADVNDADSFQGHMVLRKPFTISGLEHALASALAARTVTARPHETTAEAAE